MSAGTFSLLLRAERRGSRAALRSPDGRRQLAGLLLCTLPFLLVNFLPVRIGFRETLAILHGGMTAAFAAILLGGLSESTALLRDADACLLLFPSCLSAPKLLTYRILLRFRVTLLFPLWTLLASGFLLQRGWSVPMLLLTLPLWLLTLADAALCAAFLAVFCGSRPTLRVPLRRGVTALYALLFLLCVLLTRGSYLSTRLREALLSAPGLTLPGGGWSASFLLACRNGSLPKLGTGLLMAGIWTALPLTGFFAFRRELSADLLQSLDRERLADPDCLPLTPVGETGLRKGENARAFLSAAAVSRRRRHVFLLDLDSLCAVLLLWAAAWMLSLGVPSMAAVLFAVLAPLVRLLRSLFLRDPDALRLAFAAPGLRGLLTLCAVRLPDALTETVLVLLPAFFGLRMPVPAAAASAVLYLCAGLTRRAARFS